MSSLDDYKGSKSLNDWKKLITQDLRNPYSENKSMAIEPIIALLKDKDEDSFTPDTNIQAYANVLRKLREDGEPYRTYEVTFEKDVANGTASQLRYKTKMEVEIDKKVTEINSNTEKIRQLEGKLTTIQGQVNDLNTERDKLGREKAEVEEKLAVLTATADADTRAKAQQVGALTAETTRLQTAIAELETAKTEIQAQLNAAQARAAEAARAAAEAATREAATREAEAARAALSEAQAKATEELAANQAKITALTDQLKTANAALKDTQTELVKSNAEIGTLTAKLTEINNQLTPLQTAITTKTGEIDALTKKLAATQATLDNAQVELTRLQAENVTLKTNNQTSITNALAKQKGELDAKNAAIRELQEKLGYLVALRPNAENVIGRLTVLLGDPLQPLEEIIKDKDGADKKLLELLKLFMDTNKLKMTDKESVATIIKKFNDILIGSILADKKVSLDYYLNGLDLDDSTTRGELITYFTLTRGDKDKLGSPDEKENAALDAVTPIVGDRVYYYKEREKNPLDYQYVKDQLKNFEYDYNQAKRLKAEPIQAIVRLLSIIPPQSLSIFLKELGATEQNEDDLRKIGAIEAAAPATAPAAGGGQSGGTIDEIFDKALKALAEKYTDLAGKINGAILLTESQADDLTASINTLDVIAKEKLPTVLNRSTSAGGGDYQQDIYTTLKILKDVEDNFNKLQNPTDIGKLQRIKSTLSDINTRGGMRGGVEPVELPKDPASLIKENVKEIDDMKKTVRELIANVTGYEARFSKFYDNVSKQEKDLEDTSTTKQLTPEELKGKNEELAKIITEIKELTTKIKSQTNTEEENNLKKLTEQEAELRKTILNASDITTKQYTVASGLYQYLQDEGKNMNTDIQSKITTDKKALQEVVTKLNAILDKEPTTVKLFRDARFNIRKYLTGVQPDGKETPDNGLETLYPTIVGTIKGYYEDKYAKIKTKAEGLKKQREYELETKRAEQKGILALQPTTRGGAEPNEIITNTVAKIKGNLNGILNEILVPISQQYTKRLNPTLMAVTSASPPTLFQTLYNRYLDEVTDDPYRATERLSESMRTNHLVPKEVLEVTRNDRIIFMFTTLIIRLFGVNISNWMIDRGYITTLRGAFISYLSIYTGLILLFVAFVNLDLYRMRIIFNYVNLHANRGRIATHIIAFWIFAFFIYLYFVAISKLNKTSPFTYEAPYSLSEEDKARLQYKVQLLSIILWLLLVILIALI